MTHPYSLVTRRGEGGPTPRNPRRLAEVDSQAVNLAKLAENLKQALEDIMLAANQHQVIREEQ